MTARMETSDTTVAYRSDDYSSNGLVPSSLAVEGDGRSVRVGLDWYFDVDLVEVPPMEARRMAQALTVAADNAERGAAPKPSAKDPYVMSWWNVHCSACDEVSELFDDRSEADRWATAHGQTHDQGAHA